MNSERGAASIVVDADIGSVYALVSDITRMGEFSPECMRCEWVDGATGPAVGARFHGYNRIGDFEWDAPCEVRRVEPEKVFEFAVGSGEHPTVWTYEFEDLGGATTVTESFHAPLVNVEGARSNFPGRAEMLVKGCEATLAAIKAAVES